MIVSKILYAPIFISQIQGTADKTESSQWQKMLSSLQIV